MLAFHGTADPHRPLPAVARSSAAPTRLRRHAARALRGAPGAGGDRRAGRRSTDARRIRRITRVAADVVHGRRKRRCDPQLGATLYTVEGGGHTWPGAPQRRPQPARPRPRSRSTRRTLILDASSTTTRGCTEPRSGSDGKSRRSGVAPRMVPLSVLDLATVASGSTPAQALADTTKIAGVAEQLGYHRLWVAEHHGMPAVASSAPAVLIAHLANATTDAPGRLRRRHAAEPRAARRRRAVRDARSAAPRAASTSASGARPAPTRSPPGRCAGRATSTSTPSPTTWSSSSAT